MRGKGERKGATSARLQKKGLTRRSGEEEIASLGGKALPLVDEEDREIGLLGVLEDERRARKT